MVRNYRKIIVDNYLNNVYMNSSIITEENIDKLLMSPKYSDALKDIFFEFKNHLSGRCELGLWEIPKYEKIIKKHLRDINKDYIYQYITLSPDHNLRCIPYTEDNIKLLAEWCKKWFNDKRYTFYQYVVECGKNEDSPHLHIHCLIRLKHKKQGKNHSRDLKKFWAKYFPNSQLIGNDYYSKNVSGQYFYDKQQYFIDSEKGDHENFRDLGIAGSSE